MLGLCNLLLFLGKKSLHLEQTPLLHDFLFFGRPEKNSPLCWVSVWPNITGAVGRKNGSYSGGQSFSDCGLDQIQMDGALYATTAGNQYDIQNTTANTPTASVVNIDASRVSQIYSEVSTVQPPAFQTLMIIKT